MCDHTRAQACSGGPLVFVSQCTCVCVCVHARVCMCVCMLYLCVPLSPAGWIRESSWDWGSEHISASVWLGVFPKQQVALQLHCPGFQLCVPYSLLSCPTFGSGLHPAVRGGWQSAFFASPCTLLPGLPSRTMASPHSCLLGPPNLTHSALSWSTSQPQSRFQSKTHSSSRGFSSTRQWSFLTASAAWATWQGCRMSSLPTGS